MQQELIKNINNISQENDYLKKIIEEIKNRPPPPYVNYFKATPYTGVSIVD